MRTRQQDHRHDSVTDGGEAALPRRGSHNIHADQDYFFLSPYNIQDRRTDYSKIILIFYYNIKQEVLGIINRLFSFDTTRTAQKTTPPTILRCRGDVFTELLPSNDRGIHRQTHRLSFDKTQTAQKMTRPTILLLLHIIVTAGTCLPSRYLPKKGWIHFTERLPSIDRRDTHRHID
jgi:hypothetical protein